MMTFSILAGTITRADVLKKWIKAADAVVGASVLMRKHCRCKYVAY